MCCTSFRSHPREDRLKWTLVLHHVVLNDRRNRPQRRLHLLIIPHPHYITMALRTIAASTSYLRPVSLHALSTTALRHYPRSVLHSSSPSWTHPHVFRPIESISSRGFQTSRSSRATEEDPYAAFVENFKNSPTMKKLTESPSAVQAIVDFGKLLERHGEYHGLIQSASLMPVPGVDLKSGKQPSMWKIMKMAGDPEFVTLVERVSFSTVSGVLANVAGIIR